MSLNSAIRVPRAAQRESADTPSLAFTSRWPGVCKPATEERSAGNRFKTPARRSLGPVPDGAWAIETLTKLAAEREQAGALQQDEEDQLAGDGDTTEECFDHLPPSVQLAYATFIPRTATKMLTCADSETSCPSKRGNTRCTAGTAL